ncbi:hypothetical protein [Georgenia ruanii]|uniref:hypothetical protein n=1 Tax=Georgenia ruanii TaxID=348442 RepID=UPI001264362A|nr:hypothetical protein [Georgenia ruanii]
MTHREDKADDALARIGAADPAATALTDLPRLREAVDARLAGDLPASGTLGAVVPLAAAHKRRAGWVRVAAAVAGAAVVGAGGFLLGRSEPAAPPIGLPVPAIGSSSAGPAQERGVATDATMLWPSATGRTVFRAEGLPTAAESAAAWAFDAPAVLSADRVGAVAAALGVTGDPQQRDGVWQVGPADGTGASLSVFPDGQAGLSYHDPAADPYLCSGTAEPAMPVPEAEPAAAAPGGAEPAPADGAGSSSSSGSSGTAGACSTETGPGPDAEAATGRVRDLLAAIGLDPAGFEYEVPGATEPVTTVLAHQVVAGQRTGVQWYVGLSGAGVVSASGPLAPLVDLGDYPVVAPAAAVERLMDPRFGPLGGVSMLAAGGSVEPRPAPDTAVATSPGRPPAPARRGAPVAWPVREVTVTGARLGLTAYTDPDGTALLVPAYELTSDDGTWSVLAVAEEALDLAS